MLLRSFISPTLPSFFPHLAASLLSKFHFPFHPSVPVCCFEESVFSLSFLLSLPPPRVPLCTPTDFGVLLSPWAAGWPRDEGCDYQKRFFLTVGVSASRWSVLSTVCSGGCCCRLWIPGLCCSPFFGAASLELGTAPAVLEPLLSQAVGAQKTQPWVRIWALPMESCSCDPICSLWPWIICTTIQKRLEGFDFGCVLWFFGFWGFSWCCLGGQALCTGSIQPWG